MRFLKTFFRFFTIVTLCSTFTGGAFGNAVESSISGLSCDYNQKASCIAVNGCAYYPNKNKCDTSFCNNNGRWNCNEQAGCYNNTGSMGSENCKVCPAGKCCPEETNVNNKDPKTCEAGYYCEAGSGDCRHKACTTGHYCPSGSSLPTTCPASHPSSAAGSDESSDCYYNIPAGYEYDTSTSTNITCHAGGYCPGVKIFYNEEKKDERGWDSCNGGKFKNENTGLTATSTAGAKAATNCYVICPDETIANGSVVPYNNTTYPSNMYATQTGSNQFTYSKCKYKLTCNSGYTKSNEIDTLSNLKCNIVTYTIKYKVGDEITLTNLTPASYTVETATFNLPTTTLTGHTFAGWYTTKAFSGTAVSQITKGSTGNKTFYVKFTPNTYNLSYNLNGGTSGGTQPVEATYNSEFTVSNPTRTGYTFAGWDITDMDSVTHTYGSSTTTNTSISATKETTFKNLHSTQGATVTFTAKWTANTYNLSYNLNGGTSGGTQQATATFDKQFTVSNPTRTGYTFAGWKITGMDSVTHTYGSSTTTATSISSTTATSFKNLRSTSGTVTFEALWSANACNITYSCGTGGGTAPTVSEAPKYDSSYTTAGLGGCTKPGYYFTGWKVGNTDTILAPSTTTTKWQYETTTLTAQWADCTAGHFCTGEKTQPESCATAFTSTANASAKTQCYLNPKLKLIDTINTGGVSLEKIYTGKIYFKGNGS